MKEYTIERLGQEFPTDDACLEWIKKQRWPNGVYCPHCQKVTKHHRLKNRNCYCCDYCGKQVYPTAGTIFHKSTTALTTWFRVIYRMTATRCGISARQVQRETGVTYKTAWRISKRVRSTLGEEVMARRQRVEVAADRAGKGGGKVTPRGQVERAVVGAAQRKGKADTRRGRKRPMTKSDFNAVLEAAITPIKDDLRQ